ncbi:lysophospholipid acyltransferase family protein [Kangiella marina]|uniref:Lauroyl acyltransferase n=1 Tax=Kangiella marina TaxID=1079178 RepID=A0ABP8IJY5_9GAMM
MTDPSKQKESQVKGKAIQSQPFKVKVIRALIRFFAAMPAFVGSGFSRLFATCSRVFKSRGYQTTLTNLELCLADKTVKQRQEIAADSLRHTGKLFFEAAKIWKKCEGEQFLDKIYGEALVKDTVAQGQGVLFTGSHIGNWEVALYYLGSRYPFHCMYRPPRQQEMDEVINMGRCQNDTTMVKGDSRGVMHMIKMLKNGEVAAVLSDQEPGRRAGVFVPFCGKQALTMTIVQKIQQKSDAKLFQVAAIKNDANRYDIHLMPIDINPDQSVESYAKQVNGELEGMIRQYPEQYQWSYKRFKTTECGGSNPYQK